MRSDVGTFGYLLREYRVRAGLSQEELAEKARISAAAVGALERGIRRAPYGSTVALLAKALALDSDEIAALEAARRRARTNSAEVRQREPLTLYRTSFVGREADTSQIVKLLARSRLVTVTGPGGIGKTRCATESAARVTACTWDEQWFVDLAPLTDGAYIAAKIAATIQPPLAIRSESTADFAKALGKRRTLLILDNSEHLVADVATLVDTILELCPYVTVLNTSRERLNISGEFVYPLPPLSEHDAEELFVQRAEAAGFRVTLMRDQPAIADIVRRLGGIPLAVELAAAQLPLLGLPSLTKRLDEHFPLPPVQRDLPVRQRTVEATIRWSYDLLDDQERELLCAVSVFTGGFSLEAAEAICSSDAMERSSVLLKLSSLVNKSLLNVTQVQDGARYTILDSILFFARSRLAEAGNETLLRRRHVQWFASIADDVDLRWEELSFYDMGAKHFLEFDNVRAAVTWALKSPSPDDRALGGRILIGLYDLWDEARRASEQRSLFEAALEQVDEGLYPEIIAGLLREFIVRVHWEVATLAAINRALPLTERIGDRRALLRLHTLLVSAYAYQGMYDEAERSFERAARLLSEDGLATSRFGALLMLNVTTLRTRQGRPEEALAAIAESEAIATMNGDRYFVVCNCWTRRLHIEYQIGNAREALATAKRMLESEFGSTVDVLDEASPVVASLQMQLGEVSAAVDLVRQILVRARDGYGVERACEYGALALALRGHAIPAARLVGFVRAAESRLRKVSHDAIRQSARDLLDSTLARQVSEDHLKAASSQGARLSNDKAIDEALSALELDATV